MAQPNVAREPSMEEILASIRRIIESNEPNAENALNGHELNGRALNVNEARPREERPRPYGGGKRPFAGNRR